jgi:hypothetical protein
VWLLSLGNERGVLEIEMLIHLEHWKLPRVRSTWHLSPPCSSWWTSSVHISLIGSGLSMSTGTGGWGPVDCSMLSLVIT